MKFNMWIVEKWLEEFNPSSTIYSNNLDIESVRLFEEDFQMSSDTMYIGTMKDFFNGTDDYIICAHNNETIALDTTDLNMIFNRVLNGMDEFNNWNNALLSRLSSDAPLQSLAYVSREMMGMPFFLTDRQDKIMAFSKGNANELKEKNDPIHKAFENGEDISEIMIKIGRSIPQAFSITDITELYDPMFSYTLYIRNIFLGGERMGSVFLMSEIYPAHKGLLELFEIFCSYVDRWFQKNMSENQYLVTEATLREAINSADYSRSKLRSDFRNIGWLSDDDYLFIKLDAPPSSFNTIIHVCRTINSTVNRCRALVDDNSICAIFNITNLLDDGLSDEYIYKAITPIIEMYNYYGVVGRTFTLADSLYDHFRYATLLSENVPKTAGTLYNGDDYVMNYIFNEMKQTIVGEAYHPDAIKLLEYDRLHNTDFYNTLYYYLKNERSPKATAEEMHLHRNTLAYRIDKINELISSDLDNYMDRLYLMMSFELSEL